MLGSPLMAFKVFEISGAKLNSAMRGHRTPAHHHQQWLSSQMQTCWLIYS